MLPASGSPIQREVSTRGTPVPYHTLQSVPALPSVLSKVAQEKFLSTPLFSKLSNPKAKELNALFSWQAARIYALFETIYNQGIVTNQDLPKLKEAEKQLDAFRQTLSLVGLDEAEKSEAAHSLDQAQHVITETQTLIKALQQYNKLAVKLNASQEKCMERCYDPTFIGGALQSVHELKQMFSSFKELQIYAEKMGKTTGTGKRIEALYQAEANFLEWMVDEWAEYLQNTGEQEFDGLKTVLSLAKEEQDKLPILRQLQALQDQLKQTAKELKRRRDPRTIEAPLPAIQPVLDKLRKNCLAQANACASLLPTDPLKQFALGPLQYGSEEWLELVNQRPAPEKGWMAKKVEQLQQPWSDRSKDKIVRALAALQLSAGILDFRVQGPPARAKSESTSGKDSSSLVPQESETIIPAAAKAPTGVASLLQKVSSFFNRSVTSPSSPLFSHELIQTKAKEGYQTLKEASIKLQELRSGSVLSKSEDQEALAHEIASLQMELKKLVSETPAAGSSLLAAAEWLQAVEDKDYAVKVLYDFNIDKQDRSGDVVPEVKSPLHAPVSHKYGDLQDPLNLFLDTPPIALDKSVLLHLVLDIAGKESGLEGNRALKMMTYSLAMIQAKINSLLGKGVCDDASKLQLCYELFPLAKESGRLATLNFFQDLESKLEKAIMLHQVLVIGSERELNNKLKEEVGTLAPNQSFFFPGGWKGHGIVYEVIKQEDEKLTFRIYNTGEGVNSFKRTVVGTDTLYMPFEEIIDIPPEKFLDPVLIASLRQLQIDDSPDKDRLGPHQLMEQILPELGGKISDKVYGLDALRAIQQSGTCSHLSLVAAFSQKLGDQKTARRFEFESQLKALVDFDTLHAPTYSEDWQARNLVKKGIAAFSSLLEHTWKGLLSDQEREIVLSRLLPISKRIQEAEALTQQKQAVLIKQGLDPVEKAGNFPADKIDLLEAPNLTERTKLPAPYVPLTMREWVPNPTTFTDDTKKILDSLRWYVQYDYRSSDRVKKEMMQFISGFVFYEWQKLKNLISNPPPRPDPIEYGPMDGQYKELGFMQAPGNFLNANEGIKEFALKIPLDDPQFWQQLPKEKATKIVDLLAAISREFVFNLVEVGQRDVGRAMQLKGSDYLTLYKLLRAADKAARISGVLGEFPSLYQNTFDKLFDNKSLYFTLIEPEWAIEAASLRAEWAREKPTAALGHSFFNYEKFRSGSKMQSWALPETLKEYEEFPNGPPELNWVIQWIKQPSFQKQIRTIYPEIEKKNLLLQAVYVLAPTRFNLRNTLHVNFLPSTFYRLGELSYLADYVLTGTLSKKIKPLSFLEQDNRCVYSGLIQQSEEKLRVNLYRGFDPEIRDKENMAEDQHFQEALQDIRDEALKDLFSSFSDMKASFPPNQLITFDVTTPDLNITAKTAAHFSLQQMRKLLSLTADRTLQVQQTLGYFKERPQLLTQEGYQDLFNLLLFDAGLLPEELKSASFRSELAIFLTNNFYAAKKRGQFRAAIFFLQISRKCSDIYHALSLKDPVLFPLQAQKEFPDSRAELHSLLTSSDISDQERYSVHREVVRSYRNEKSLDTNQLIDFLTSALTLDRTRIIYPEHVVSNKEADIEARDALRFQRVAIQHLMSGPDRNAILNRLLQTFYPKAADLSWSVEEFPKVKTIDGSFAIDLLRGELFERNTPIKVVPFELANNPSFAEIFGKDVHVVALEVQEGVFECKDRYENLYRVRKEPKFLFERKFGEEWHINIPASALHFEPRALYEGKSIWSKPGNMEREGISQTGYILDNISLIPVYCFDVNREGLFIHQLDKNGDLTDLVVADLEKRLELLTLLTRIEDSSHLVGLQERDGGDLASIELPRYELTFKVEEETSTGEPLAVIRGHTELEGYSLSKTGGIPTLEYAGNYLVLEKKGQKRVIFPDVQFVKVEHDSLRPKVERNTPQGMKKGELFIADYNTDTGVLEPLNESGRLFFAKLYLWKHEYQLAEKYLTGMGAQLRSLKPGQMRQLEQIAQLDEENQDPHPLARALRLKAFAQLLKNEEDFPSKNPLEENFLQKMQQEEKFFKKMLQEEYPRYLENLEYIGKMTLSPEEELLLLRRIGPTKDLVFANRVSQLEAESFGMLVPSKPATEMKTLNQPPLGMECGWNDLCSDFYMKNYHLSDLSDTCTKILQNTLSADFVSYYEFVRDLASKSDEEVRAITQKLSGIDHEVLNGVSRETMLAHFQKVLDMKLRKDNKNESGFALILKMILEYPNQFPSSCYDLKIYLKVGKEGSFDERQRMVKSATDFVSSILDKAKELYQPLMPSPSHLPLTIPSSPASEARTSKEIDGVCLQLSFHPFSEKPLMADWKQFFSPIEAIEISVDSPAAHGRSDISQLFDTPATNSLFKRELDSLEEQMDAYLVSKKKRTLYTLKEGEMHGLHRLKNDLTGAIELSKTRLAAHRASIESALNRPFPDKGRQVEREMRILAGSEQPLFFDEAVQLFFRLDSALFRKRNPALSDQDVAGLIEEIRGVLKMSTDLQQMERLAGKIDTLEKIAASGNNGEKLKEAIQDVIATGSAKREYEISEHPEYLVFEYADNKLLRKDQVDNLDKLKIKEGKIGDTGSLGAVLEMMMGAGKTSVILLLLSMLNADGENLSVAILPDSLFASMSPEVQKGVFKIFKQVLESIELKRDTSLDAGKLLRLYERLSRIISERKTLLIKSGSMQTLFLKYVEKWKSYATLMQSKPKQDDPAKSGLEKELQLFQQIFRLFKESGNVLIDEVDTILDVLKSFHFTIGEPQPLNALYINVVSDLYQFLATDESVNQKIRLPFAASPGHVPFTKDVYDQQIKPLLSQSLLEGKLGKNEEELQEFFKTLSSEEKTKISLYLQGDMEAGEQILLNKASEGVQDLIALYKEEIDQLLPLTAEKNVNEHYGKIKLGKEEGEEIETSPIDIHLAIPYRSGEPSKNSQHGTELEQENYTIQMVLQEGITRDIIEKELARVKALFAEETLKFPLKAREELPSYRYFLRLSKGALYDPANLKEKEIQAIVANVNSDRTLQIDLIKKYILPKITVYEMQLDADSQLFGMLFRRIQGMSGTLWNVQTFTKMIGALFPSMTAPEVIDLLWNKIPDSVTPLTISETGPQEQQIEQALKQIYGREGFPNGSMIDTAGIFRNIKDRSLIGKALLKMECWKGTDIKGFGFYDENGVLMILSEVNGVWTATPFAQSRLTKEELIFFWDQQHTFGSDIKLGPLMGAAMTVGRHSILRDILQGVLRLRDIAKGQNVNFIVTDEDRDIIAATLNREMNLGIGESQPLTLAHILLYTIYTQSQRQGSDNYRSFKQKMHNYLREKLYTLILDPKVSFEELAPIFEECSELFMTNQKVRPFELYGRSKKLGRKEEVVQQDLEQMLKSRTVTAFRTHPLLKKLFPPAAGLDGIDIPLEFIRKELSALAVQELNNFPEELQQSARYGKERSIQVEQAKQKEQQKEQDIQRQQQQERVITTAALPTPLPVIPWKTANLFKRDFYVPEEVVALAKTAPADIANKHRPVITLSDLLNSYRAFSYAAAAFDPRLSCSVNLCPVFDSGWMDYFLGTSYVPTGKYQKELSYALVIEDKETKEMRMVLMDENDAAQFKQLLKEDQEKGEALENREVRLGLYHFESETIDAGKEGVDPEKFKSDPTLLRLKVQAKFFGGKTSYNEQELESLENWLRADGVQALHGLFKKNVLKWKEESGSMYEGSALHQLFLKLGVKS